MIKGYPWPVQAVWNSADDKVVYTNLQCDYHPAIENTDIRDTYFENEYAPESDVLCWMRVDAPQASD